jgi:murein DD-endopeptidase MepM/ murein hydrolase activator NlpD
MVNPVPGRSVTTAYRKPGDADTWTMCGWHTGQDYAAPEGTLVVAARGGTVKHTAYGSAYGDRQFAVVAGDGTEDFYAHCNTRPENGARVEAGQGIAQVGARGNVTGPHLHFERHQSAAQGVACSNMDDPMKSHNDGGGTVPDPYASGDVHQDKLVPGQYDSDSVRRMQRALNEWSFQGGQELPITGNYLHDTQHEVGLFQAQVCGDPPDGAIGPKQTDRLFTVLGPWNIIR